VNTDIDFRHPGPDDGPGLHGLIQACPPLDVNTVYAYCLLARHYPATCLLAWQGQELVAGVTGYRLPERPLTWFVWQVAVHETGRGQGLAGRLLDRLFDELKPDTVETTIGPGNAASRGLFRSFAERHQLSLDISPYLAADVCGPGHEAEDLFRLKRPQPATGATT
jgi:L-2,4-diaminobutyric acid acetyltransferase